MKRYSRNIPAISLEEQAILKNKKVLVIGCGGLGGYIIENLVRLGVGRITAVDGDSFEETNLNRQLLSSEKNMGKSKALAAKTRSGEINPFVELEAVEDFFCEENADILLADADIVVDALDNVASRLLLEEKCSEKNITIVHGAVLGWNAQISVVKPKSGMLKRLYSGGTIGEKTCLGFVPQFCASLQCAEAVKILLGRKSTLEGKILFANLMAMDFNIIEF